MISGIKKDTGSFVYMRLKKHVCPDCGQPVFLKKIKKKIKSDSRAAKNYDFHIGDVELKGTVKFIWYEFRCTDCGNQFTETEMREFEVAEKKREKAEARAAKKAEKKAQKQAKKESKKG
ncbi:MAG: hypothetical protein IKB23_00770 [Clostridia bacterium]|nr:hypothetical protein [Clostridia bacterium]MBR2431432.1 hypothetical protein [Clostridia bacterium]